ncbi:sodium/potassium/calcium exchanger 2-like [Branchiostoma lanceolatum]|uniref:sodium/potassium/calcium exchanger 2-like n=1 Tax=Branchiostoma lanceolatum TaxID=7740 RepID=UPI0034534B94
MMRIRKRKEMLWLTIPMVTVVLTVLVLVSPGRQEYPAGGGAPRPDKGTNSFHTGYDKTSRSLLQFVDDHIHSTGEPDLRYLDGEIPNCTLASIMQFPPDPMPAAVRRNGGVLLHVLVVVYMFSAIAIVCDDYFVPSLETTSTNFHKH